MAPAPLPHATTADRLAPLRLRRALLDWYGAQRRDLPWRDSRDAYRVWVSEVMLQQTRVEVVVPAYRRFLRAFPTLARLARAREEEVLAQWSGLGYYARARALHRAARLLHQRGEGFPRRREAALALPGVGAYTAAAVLSIAYGEAHAAVDGNIVRVLSRLRRLPRPDGRGEPHQSLAQALLEARRPGDWNQAMMELGQTICLPRNPRCGDCPLSLWCEAQGHGDVDRFPAPKPRRRSERVALQLIVVRDARGRLLLEKGAFPHLDHLWLPLVDAADEGRVPGTARSNARLAAAVPARGNARLAAAVPARGNVGRAVPGPPRPRRQKGKGRAAAAPLVPVSDSRSRRGGPGTARPTSARAASALRASARATSARAASARATSALRASALRTSALPTSALPTSALPTSALPAATATATFRHAILHRAFEVRVALRTASDAEIRRLLRSRAGGERRLFTARQLGGIGRSSLLTKALAHVGTQHS